MSSIIAHPSTLYSGQNDVLYGGEGDDQLAAGGRTNHAIMYGGLGADYFECDSLGAGTILDYNPGEGDRKTDSCHVANS